MTPSRVLPGSVICPHVPSSLPLLPPPSPPPLGKAAEVKASSTAQKLFNNSITVGQVLAIGIQEQWPSPHVGAPAYGDSNPDREYDLVLCVKAPWKLSKQLSDPGSGGVSIRLNKNTVVIEIVHLRRVDGMPLVFTDKGAGHEEWHRWITTMRPEGCARVRVRSFCLKEVGPGGCQQYAIDEASHQRILATNMTDYF